MPFLLVQNIPSGSKKLESCWDPYSFSGSPGLAISTGKTFLQEVKKKT